MIYLLAKARQKCKQRRNLIVILPLNMVHQPCLNNLQFNPIIVKSKIFILYSLTYVMFIIIFFTFHMLKIEFYIKYKQVVEVLLVNFPISVIIPVNIYLKNPSLRKYLWNELIVCECFLIVFQHWNIKVENFLLLLTCLMNNCLSVAHPSCKLEIETTQLQKNYATVANH